MALAAHDESYVFGELCIIDAGGIVGRLDGNDSLALGDDLVEVGLLSEIPADVATARGGGAAHFPQAMFGLLAEEAHLRGPDVVSDTDHGSHVVGGHEVVGDDDGAGDALVDFLRGDGFEKIV